MKILIIDDEVEILDSFKLFLRKNINRTLFAQSGYEAIELIKANNSIGLIISDFTMSNGSGLDVLSYIESINLPVKFYFFSAHDVDDISSSFLTGRFEKPDDLGELMQLIREYLASV